MNSCELHRYIWLDFSKARLAISPLIAVAISVIVYLSSNNADSFYKSWMITSGIMTGMILLLWGTKQASDSITTEVSQQTWVFQRMSSIDAWDMTIGKLFGSTLYPWYSAAFFVIAYVIGAISSNGPLINLKYLVVLLLSAVAVHASAMIVCLVTIRENRYTGRTNKGSSPILSLILIYFIFSIIPVFVTDSVNSVTWFTWNFGKIDWFIITSIFVAIWAVVGLQRNMRTELQYENGPVVWCVFLFTILAYVNGLVADSSVSSMFVRGNRHLWASFILLLLVLVATIGIDTFTVVSIRKMANAVITRNRKEFMCSIPLWLITLMALLTAVLLIQINDVICGWTIISIGSTSKYIVTLLPISVLLFMARDIIVIGSIKNSGTNKAEYYIAAYLASMYILFPVILNLTGVKMLLHIFWPIPLDGFLWQIIPGIVQIMLLVILLIRKRYWIYNNKLDVQKARYLGK